jgi:hypothetical protein
MTRQWLARPEDMCIRHLTGEHAEAHSFVTKMEKGQSLLGFRVQSMFFGALLSRCSECSRNFVESLKIA